MGGAPVYYIHPRTHRGKFLRETIYWRTELTKRISWKNWLAGIKPGIIVCRSI